MIKIVSYIMDFFQILTDPAEPMQLRYCLEMTIECLTPALMDLTYSTSIVTI